MKYHGRYWFYLPVLADGGRGWHQENLPVVKNSLCEGQHRGSDHDSTRTNVLQSTATHLIQVAGFAKVLLTWASRE